MSRLPDATFTSDENFMTESSYERNAPRLSRGRLTIMLVLMCVVPLLTIFTLFQILPPVEEGTLEASVSAEGLPAAEFYEIAYDQRAPFAGGVLVVNNESTQDWTHLNIQVNRNYQIYDIEPIPAGGSAKFQLDRFVSRTGARFSLRYNPLKSVRIYARRPTKDRATFYYEF
jgi:hypothetical protein